METYRYRAFGLTIASELECPELIPTSGEPDVTISYGRVPEKLSNPNKEGLRYSISDRQYLLKVDQIANYLVDEGTRVTIEPHTDAEDRDLRLFLLGSVMGAVCHQRQILLLHSSAVKKGEHAVLFTGRSGLGKSTTAMALAKRGYPMISDDLTAITFDGDTPIAYPAYPQSKLWEDSLSELGLDAGQFPELRARIGKRSVPNTDHFYNAPLPVSRIYVLGYRETDNISLQPIEGPALVVALKNMTYRPQILEAMPNKKSNFKAVSKLAKAVTARHLIRPQNSINQLNQSLSMIEADWDHIS